MNPQSDKQAEDKVRREKMKTFSKKITKEALLKEIRSHRKQDMLVQGTYGKENGHWKGCAVACALRSIDIIEGNELRTCYDAHKDYETKLGIPEWLARLEDTIFEGLTQKDALLWPERFIKAIPVGVDVARVKYKFCAFILKENIDRVLKLEISNELKKEVVNAIQGVLVLHEQAATTGRWSESAAESARSAARSAAESAARSAWPAAESAARSAAESAAESAARSAWFAAESAAWPAAWSAAESAARSAAWSAAESARSAARSAWFAARSAWFAARSAAESAAYKKYAKELLRLLAERD